MERSLPAALALLFCGCFLRPGPQPPPGITVSSRLAAEPETDLFHDKASHRSFFLWSLPPGAAGPEVSLLAADARGAAEWALQPGRKDAGPAARYEGRLAVSPSGVYAVWIDSSPAGLGLYAAASGYGGKALLPKTRISGIASLIANAVAVAASGGDSVYVTWQDFDPRLRTHFIGLASVGPEGLRWRRTLGDKAPSESYMTPAIAAAGEGGVLAAFRHYHDGDKGVVVRRFSADGASWPDDVQASGVLGYKSAPQLTGDGAGGAFVTWEDGRAGNLDIYAQHISSGGAVLWDPAGLPVAASEGNQWNPRLTYDGAGGFFCGWIDDNKGSRWVLKAQRADAAGRALWGPDGVTALDSDGKQSLPSLVYDGLGGLIAAWNEDRDGNAAVLAQRFSGGGEALWGPDAVQVTRGGHDDIGPAAAADGEGGCVVAWKHRFSGKSWAVRAQRLDAGGSPAWR